MLRRAMNDREKAFKATGWNKSAASRMLGITTKTLREKISRYGIVEKGDPEAT